MLGLQARARLAARGRWPAGRPFARPRRHPAFRVGTIRHGEARRHVSETRSRPHIGDPAQTAEPPLDGGTPPGRQRCEAEFLPQSWRQPSWRRRSACSPRAAARPPIPLKRAINPQQWPSPASPASPAHRHRAGQTQPGPTPLRRPRRARAKRRNTPQRSRARRQEEAADKASRAAATGARFGALRSGDERRQHGYQRCFP